MIVCKYVIYEVKGCLAILLSVERVTYEVFVLLNEVVVVENHIDANSDTIYYNIR